MSKHSYHFCDMSDKFFKHSTVLHYLCQTFHRSFYLKTFSNKMDGQTLDTDFHSCTYFWNGGINISLSSAYILIDQARKGKMIGRVSIDCIVRTVANSPRFFSYRLLYGYWLQYLYLTSNSFHITTVEEKQKKKGELFF